MLSDLFWRTKPLSDVTLHRATAKLNFKKGKQSKAAARASSDTHWTGRGQRPESSSRSRYSPVRLPLPPPERRGSSDASAGPPSYAPTPGRRGAPASRAYGAAPLPPHRLPAPASRLLIPAAKLRDTPGRLLPSPCRCPCPAAASPQTRRRGRVAPDPHSPPPAGAPTAAILSGRGEGRAQARPRRSRARSGGRAHARARAPPRPVSAHLPRRDGVARGSSSAWARSLGVGHSGSVTWCGSATQGQSPARDRSSRVSHPWRVRHREFIPVTGPVTPRRVTHSGSVTPGRSLGVSLPGLRLRCPGRGGTVRAVGGESPRLPGWEQTDVPAEGWVRAAPGCAWEGMPAESSECPQTLGKLKETRGGTLVVCFSRASRNRAVCLLKITVTGWARLEDITAPHLVQPPCLRRVTWVPQHCGKTVLEYLQGGKLHNLSRQPVAGHMRIKSSLAAPACPCARWALP